MCVKGVATIRLSACVPVLFACVFGWSVTVCSADEGGRVEAQPHWPCFDWLAKHAPVHMQHSCAQSQYHIHSSVSQLQAAQPHNRCNMHECST